MRYLGTAFSLTLGAWRLRVSIDLEDAPLDDAPAAAVPLQAVPRRSGSTSR
jgi:hypothetical protein